MDDYAGTEASREVVPVFTSVDTLANSGLSKDVPSVTPSPPDLADLVGADRWVAVDPGSDDVCCMPLSALVSLWNALSRGISET